MLEQNNFNEYGAVFVEKFIDEKSISIISQYFENKINRGEWVEKVSDEVTKFYYYADPLTEVFLLKCKDFVESIVGEKIIPTYSYARIYQPNEKLEKHTDRPSCEISVTVNVASLGPLSKIFMVEEKNKTKKPFEYVLKPGDAVVYKGCEMEHWRDTLQEGQLNVQFMLHYVKENGINRVYAKDGRSKYGTKGK